MAPSKAPNSLKERKFSRTVFSREPKVSGWKEAHPGALRAQGTAATLPVPLQHRSLGTLTGATAAARVVPNFQLVTHWFNFTSDSVDANQASLWGCACHPIGIGGTGSATYLRPLPPDGRVLADEWNRASGQPLANCIVISRYSYIYSYHCLQNARRTQLEALRQGFGTACTKGLRNHDSAYSTA
jgi:hypothetical protein